jgi:hypothetical protein
MRERQLDPNRYLVSVSKIRHAWSCKQRQAALAATPERLAEIEFVEEA